MKQLLTFLLRCTISSVEVTDATIFILRVSCWDKINLVYFGRQILATVVAVCPNSKLAGVTSVLSLWQASLLHLPIWGTCQISFHLPGVENESKTIEYPPPYSFDELMSLIFPVSILSSSLSGILFWFSIMWLLLLLLLFVFSLSLSGLYKLHSHYC